MVNMRLRVDEEGDVIVSGPWQATFDDLKRFYQKNEAFVKKALETRDAQNPLPDRWDENTRLIWHAKDYPLKIVENSSQVEAMTFENETFVWTTKHLDPGLGLTLYTNTLATLLLAYARAFLKTLGIEAEITIGNYRSRWGVCQIDSRRLILNVNLALLPPQFTDYLIAHEAAHLDQANHAEAFYERLAELYPAWRAVRQALKQYTHMWL